MSEAGEADATIVAFGDLAGDIWGVQAGAEPGDLTVGSYSDRAVTAAADGAVASVTPSAGRDAARGGLGLVTVSLRVGGGEHELPGISYRLRAERKLDAVRLATAWFPPERAVAIAASRQQGAKGHDDDVIEVATPGEPEELVVFDPRLSTTYGPAGRVRRMGIELWLGEDEDGDLFPRRYAGEATGAHAAGSGRGVRWEAGALRCHSRGEDGAGLYLVLRPA